MSLGCTTGQPISWLRLERYHLDELPEAERRLVAAHLEGCAVCADCASRLAEDEAPLPPLPAAAPPRAARPWRWLPALVPAMAAAVLAVIVLRPEPAPDPRWRPARVAVKGGDLGISLVRERGGAVHGSPRAFAAGDRFQIRLTCPGPVEATWDVVVYQGAESSFPYSPVPVTCGNEVPLPGAFTLTGDAPATVCVVLGGVPRDSLAAALPEAAACVRLAPPP